jgi:hypothetical protein
VVDANGKLDPAVYAAVFASSRPAYLASKHWSRRSSAQRKATPLRGRTLRKIRGLRHTSSSTTHSARKSSAAIS